MPKTKTAKNVQAVVIQAECPCGGAVMMAGSGSFDLSAGDEMICSECESPIRLTVKTARIFS